jgi:hypothetical protein
VWIDPEDNAYDASHFGVGSRSDKALEKGV